MKSFININTDTNFSNFLSELIAHPQADDRLLEWTALLALENKEWTLAERIFTLLLERREKSLDLVGLAKSLRMQGRLLEAQECYLESLNNIKQACPLLFTVYKALGEIHLLENDFYQAEEYYNKASTLKPSCKSLVFARAMLSLKEKKYEQAETYFQNYLHSHNHSKKAWLGLALSRKALNKPELAWACLKKCLDIDPHNFQALKVEKVWKKSLCWAFVNKSLSFSA